MPSYASGEVAVANGIVTSTGETVPTPQSTMFAAGTGAVLLFEPLIAVWLDRSRAKPVTLTACPRLTRLLLPVNTKMPSEVAGSASPVAS